MAALLAWSVAAAAADPVSAAASTGDANASTLDERVNQLASELRCLVCQNQTVADSHAPLAVQLKQEVRKQLAAGASADEVRDFMVQRYGDFVLYRPPVKAGTLALWIGPVVILLGALVGLWLVLRKRRLQTGEVPDEEDEREGDRNEHDNHNNGEPGQDALADGPRTA